MNKKYFTVEVIAKIAILGALSAILLIFNFAIPIAPTFYKVDFADLPALIGGFAMGPIAAAMIEFIKIVINIIMEAGSTTMFVGEISNMLMGMALTVPAAYYYQKNRTMNGAIKSMIIGSICMVIVAGLLNYFAIIPAYVKFMHFPLDAIIGMGNKIFPFVTSKLTLVLFCTIPFNIIKALLTCLVARVLYKHLSPILKIRS